MKLTLRDVLTQSCVSRTGNSLAVGALYRYVGGMGAPSSQQLHTAVSILLALAQDVASPPVQIWSLHALVRNARPLFNSACLLLNGETSTDHDS